MDGEVRKINPCSGQISHIQWASENWQAEIDFGEGKLSLELHTLDSLGLASTIQRDGKGDEDSDIEALFPTQEKEHVIGVRLFVLLAAATVGAFVGLLDTSIISTAIPRITSDFNSLTDLAWYGSAYQIASAGLVPLTGKLYTHFSTKWTFLSFFAIFELGSLLCGIASSSKMLIVGRAVAGIGSSALQNGILTIIAAVVPLERQPTIMGFVMGVAFLGIVLGPLIGGAFTEYATWRWCFYINLPIGALLSIVIALIEIPDQDAKAKRAIGQSLGRLILDKFDPIGFILFAPAAIQLLLALQYGVSGNEYAWSSPTVIGLFIGSGATFIAFIIWEYRHGDDAMIPLSMLSQTIVWTSCLVCSMLTSTAMIGSYFLPIYFQAVRDVSPMISGVYLLPSILSQLAVAVVSGGLVGKLGFYAPWAVLSGIATAAGNGIMSLLEPATPAAKWIGYQVLVGGGRGAGLQMPMIAIQTIVTQNQVPVALALLTTSQTIAGAIWLTIANVIFNSTLQTEVRNRAPSIDPQVLITAGASKLRDVVPSYQLSSVLVAYSISVNRTFYLAAGMGVVLFCATWGMGWKDVRKKEGASATAA